MKDLNFYWRMGDYALEACPKRLARFTEDEPNETIDLVKYYQHKGNEYKYSIGYFYYNTREPCWELKFVGGRFKDILEGDVTAIFKMLVSAYDTLEEWSNSRCDICDHKGCEECIANALDEHCIPSQFNKQIEDECAKEYEELGLKELKELIEADRKDEPTGYNLSPVDKDINVRSKDEPQTDCPWK